MIRATLTGASGAATVLLGLSRENVRRLTLGMPVLVDLQGLLPGAPAGSRVALVFGETEAEIVNAMRAAGLPVPPVDPS